MKTKIVWTGNLPGLDESGKQSKHANLLFQTRTESFAVAADAEIAKWLEKLFVKFSAQNRELLSLQDLKHEYEKNFSSSFESFLRSPAWRILRAKGLLV